MAKLDKNKDSLTRRRFLTLVGRGLAILGLGGVTAAAASRGKGRQYVWQIDPWKCVQCSRCQTECVLDVSAVKCVHDYTVCGYCKLCFGFFQTEPFSLDSGAENQMCPTAAIKRTFVEDPYHQYTIDESLCNACGKCVKGCTTFGNGSLYLQVRHDRCVNCNECAIAASCPADAFIRLPASKPYVIKNQGQESIQSL